jgi:hypothetical protein
MHEVAIITSTNIRGFEVVIDARALRNSSAGAEGDPLQRRVGQAALA